MARKARFYLTRPKDGEPSLITMKFSYKSVRIQASTEEAVLPEHWDHERQRIADKWVDKIPDYLEVNRILDDLNNFVVYTYNDHRRKVKLAELTPNVFKGMIKEKITGISPAEIEEQSVMDFYKRYLFDRANDGTLKKQTVKNERSAFNKFEKFSQQFPGTILFRHVNLRMFKQYRDWLWKSGTNTDSSVYKHINLFRRMLLAAAANGRDMGCDVKAISLKSQLNLSRQAMDTIALSESDIATLHNLDLSETPGKERVRDLFIMGCYTGLRYNRWGEINRSNVITKDGVELLQLFTAKGKRKQITLPIHPTVKRICESYGWELPKVPKDQVVNRQLKEICKMAGFVQKVQFARNVRGNSVIQTYHKWELVSTHTARRSFATNAYLAGVPFEDIQAMTGHGSRKMLSHYIKEDGTHRAKRLSQTEWFGNDHV